MKYTRKLTLKQKLIKGLMLLRRSEIEFDMQKGATFREVFNHPDYLALPHEEKMKLGLAWAEELYDEEKHHPLFQEYFEGTDVSTHFPGGARVLDIGCYLGGKTVGWAEKYPGISVHGIDIDPQFIAIANEFARKRGANATFSVDYAESLPFADKSIDVIISENTFEHVPDVQRALDECARVLVPHGLLIAIFPPLGAPFKGHHLDLVTRTPLLQWFFSYPDLLRAYFSILDDRGASANWYRRPEEAPLSYERGYSVNGTGARDFERLITDDWGVVADGFSKGPLGYLPEAVVARLIKKAPFGVVRELFPIAYVLQILG